MRAPVVICISQHAEIKVPSFTHIKYMIEALKIKKIWSRGSDHAPFRCGLLLQAILIKPTSIQN